MVAGVLAIDLIARKYAFNSQHSYDFTQENVTEKFLGDLASSIQENIHEDIRLAIVVTPSTLSRSLKDYFSGKLDEIGIINTTFIRYETAYLIGALEYGRVQVTEGQSVAAFYRCENRCIGDLWKKTGDCFSFEKRLCYSSTETGFQNAVTQVPNHIFVTSHVRDAQKYFPNIRFQVFQENDTFLLGAALVKARILLGDNTLKAFDAQDIGDTQIPAPRGAATKSTSSNFARKPPSTVFGISVGSDTFSVAKYENGKAEIIKNASNEEVTRCVVVNNNGQLSVGGNQSADAVLLEHCMDLLGAKSIQKKEPFTKLNLAINDEAPHTKVCYTVNGRIVNVERVAAELFNSIKSMCGEHSGADIVFALTPEIKNNPEKLNVFLRLAKEAGLESSKIIDMSLATCLGGSQGTGNGGNEATYIGINVSGKKIDAVLFKFTGNEVAFFKEASRTFPPPNPNNTEFVAELREHLLVIAKTAFDVLKSMNLERADVGTVLLNYNGKFRETTKEFLQRMFSEKRIVELQNSRSVAALGAAIFGAV